VVLTSGSKQGQDLGYPRNELGSRPDNAVAVKEEGVELVEEGRVLLGGGELLGCA
jgi:hypothetical protein